MSRSPIGHEKLGPLEHNEVEGASQSSKLGSQNGHYFSRALCRQKSHSFSSISGSVFWQNWHIKPFFRIIMHVLQNNLRNSLLGFSFTSSVTILEIRGCISSMSWIFIRDPLTCRVYLLTADCDIPSISATSFCVSLRVSRSSIASVALIAGITDFTAISHGSIKVIHCS